MPGLARQVLGHLAPKTGRFTAPPDLAWVFAGGNSTPSRIFPRSADVMAPDQRECGRRWPWGAGKVHAFSNEHSPAFHMIEIRTVTHVAGLKGIEVTSFLLNPTDTEYRMWWKGTHLQLHPITGSAGTGKAVYMDEYIGARRVRMTAILIESIPGVRIAWQLKKIIKLPVWLSLELEDDHAGVTITHTIRAGFAGAGRILDPLLRASFSKSFTMAMDEHVKIEFPKLRDMLHRSGTCEASGMALSKPSGDVT